MNLNGSLTDFFYNIIPGGVFIYSLKLFVNYDIFSKIKIGDVKVDTAIVIFTVIIFGLFFGFIFQGLTKLIRDWFWNKKIFKEVKSVNPKRFEKCYRTFKSGDDEQGEEQLNENAFYLMDNFLRGEQATFLPTHFSARFAFWANISWATFFLLVIIFFTSRGCNSSLIFLVIFLYIAIKLADRHLYAFYDAVLKSYYMHALLKRKVTN